MRGETSNEDLEIRAETLSATVARAVKELAVMKLKLLRTIQGALQTLSSPDLQLSSLSTAQFHRLCSWGLNVPLSHTKSKPCSCALRFNAHKAKRENGAHWRLSQKCTDLRNMPGP